MLTLSLIYQVLVGNPSSTSDQTPIIVILVVFFFIIILAIASPKKKQQKGFCRWCGRKVDYSPPFKKTKSNAVLQNDGQVKASSQSKRPIKKNTRYANKSEYAPVLWRHKKMYCPHCGKQLLST